MSREYSTNKKPCQTTIFLGFCQYAPEEIRGEPEKDEKNGICS